MKSSKSKAKKLKSKLDKMVHVSSSRKERVSTRLNNNKDLSDYFKELQDDFDKMRKKLNIFAEALSNVFERLDALEEEVSKLRARPPPSTPSFASVVQSAPDNKRLEKLEQFASEEERKSRILEITITHPQIDVSNENLLSHVKSFMADKLQMEPREIDSGFNVKKVAYRPNTVIVVFSAIKFIRFVFGALKRLRLRDQDLCTDLFINDNMTSYNYSILKHLKGEKKKRSEERRKSFESVYVFDGKVYVKKQKTNQPNSAIWISSVQSMKKFLESLDTKITAVTDSNGL